MDAADLPAAGITAFTSVFVLLAVLAGVIRLVTLLFPERAERPVDPALAAALAAAVAASRPGARVTRIAEET
jgi:hypothetical protein